MLRGRFVNDLSIKYNGNIFSLHMIASDKANLFVQSVLLVAKFYCMSLEVFYHHICTVISTHEEEGMI